MITIKHFKSIKSSCIKWSFYNHVYTPNMYVNKKLFKCFFYEILKEI